MNQHLSQSSLCRRPIYRAPFATPWASELKGPGKSGSYNKIWILSKIAWGLTVFSVVYLSFIPTLTAASVHPKAGTTSATFLKIGAGARAVGMGEAFGALANDASALYWNPAGITQLKQKEITLMHDESFQDIRYGYLGYVHPMKHNQALGFSLSGLVISNDLERRSGLNEDVPETPLTPSEGTFGAHDVAAGMTYAWRPRGRVSAGLTAKMIQQVIDSEGASGLGIDAGILYRARKKPVSLAAVLQNFGPAMKFANDAYNLPLNVKLGAAYTPHPKLDLAMDLNQPIDNYLRVHTGLEFRPLNFFFLRTGYKYRMNGNELGALSGLTMGAGFSIQRFIVDYAYNPAGDVGNTHRVSLTYRFGGPAAAAVQTSTDAASIAPPEEDPSAPPPEDQTVPFRLVLKPQKGQPDHYQVLAEANAPSDVYRLIFTMPMADSQDKTLKILEAGAGADEKDGKLYYQMVVLEHNFPQKLSKVGVAFRVKKSWLRENKVAKENMTLARLEGNKLVPQPTEIRGDNVDFVSYRANLDQEGTLVIIGTPTLSKNKNER